MTIPIEQWMIEVDIASLQRAMERGELTSEQLVQAYIDRINRINPIINAVLEINPEALEMARKLDKERSVSGVRSPLHGIPILLKDNIDTADQMHTSAGSIALANSYAAKDSFVASQLRNAGAVLLGKTNMTEWANFMTMGMPSGYSSRGGQVLNPYGLGTIDVGGSSSGSGASIAANLAAAAIGTETSGSIVNPAIQNSLVGLKPTVGLVSRTGIIPISSSQDSAGPMTRTVADTALLLGLLVGIDENDEATLASEGKLHRDYTQFLDSSFISQARIGIPRFYYDLIDEEGLVLIEAAIDVLRQKGATIIDPISIPHESDELGGEVMRYEFKVGLNAYLSQLPSDAQIHSLQDLIAFNKDNEQSALRYGQTTLEWSEETSGSLTDPAYLQAKQRDIQFTQSEGLDYVLDHYELDALFLPSDEGTDLAARAGYPVLTVPVGYTSKGPMGVTFTGRAYSEPTLIKLAYALEQATLHRVPPEL
ncbi:amidase [Paenibacillus albiflavus]|uniref:Amidase n=1 Tax=Paenibacillus albiflavus TaxID=2545760 RepID=A0A4R4EKB3_9BACL|nr:amidase family protein [Paenibacillus albiflavus]TCZ79893.1 amidase [Paenibacillus albiflavus]